MNAIISPQMLWKDFDNLLPLKESIVSETVYDNLIVKNVRFLGRETPRGRVDIFAVYACIKSSSRRSLKGTILIIPDYTDTVDKDLINIYTKQGYNVLMVDYRGRFADAENYTIYPDDIYYANFENAGRNLDYADLTAKDTCWYEWVAVMKYALSYLKMQDNTGKIGVLGIKNGSNVGWMLCGTDTRVDCFVSLFGAGWRAYKGCFKNAEIDDIQKDDERIRFIAGVESQAYAQSVKCPVLYQTATNSSEFDVDRSVDTLVRIGQDGNDFVRINCYAPRLRDVLDKCCMRNIDLFFAKYLLNFNVNIPSEPKLTLEANGKNVSANVAIDFADNKRTKRVVLYISEGGVIPGFRDWIEVSPLKSGVEVEKKFNYKMNGNVDFISAFVLCEYKNGITICSKLQTKKVEFIPARDNKLVYSAQDKTGSFSVYDVKKYSAGNLFFCDEDYLLSMEGPYKIGGVYSKYGLISYKVNDKFIRLTSRSILKLDLFSYESAVVKVVLMTVEKNGQSTDYFARISVSGAEIWQNIMLMCTEFKSNIGRPIKDFEKVAALRIEAETPCIVNNILLI